ncbi:MAG TPA: porin family protein [Flavobacteriaceae bacterium]|nr:porin family protein [Flavobacteriaceae bacterium]
MKKGLLIAAIAVFGFTSANAQETSNGGFAQGDLFISGAVGFGSQKTGDAKTNSFEIAPRLGYFVSENIAVGIALGYQNSKSEDALGNETEDISTLALGAFGRYYFMPANQFSLFGQLGVEYLSTEYNIADVKVSGFGASLAPGISYFVSNNFALEATFGILGYSTVEPDGGESTDTFQFGVDMNDINFGIVYKF